MSQAAIEALLRQKFGLDPHVIGSSTIARAIRQRSIACGLSDLKAYWKRLESSTDELEALIEEIVVPETWFFRDREPFAFLSQFVLSEWLPTHPKSVLRVLSVPCSTGEEPYSIAIALLQSGLTSNRFSIDAVDLSQKAILHARRAIYGENSFRGENLGIRQQYFTQLDRKYQLHESVRSSVNFISGNLLEPLFLWQKTPYHAIFCRNLLIYLSASARKQAIQVLDRLLTDKGLLFVGHSETAQIPPSKFASVHHPFAFAFRKLEAKPNAIEVEKPRFRNALGRKHQENPLSPHRPLSPSPPLKDNSETVLKTARGLADRGQLNEAATLCETYLNQNQLSAEAYFLLGQVRQAQGWEEQALQCFHKAIYLKPDHYEALVHLALLIEQSGDSQAAEIIRQRIQRLKKLNG